MALWLHGCTHDALVFLLLLCNLTSMSDPPRAACRSVANVRVKYSNHTNLCMTDLKYGCDLCSGKYGNLIRPSHLSW